MEQTAISTKKVTLTLPSINLVALFKKITTSLSDLFSSVYNPVTKTFSETTEGVTARTGRFKMPSMKNFKFNKNILKIIIPVIAGIIVIAAIANFVRSLPDAKSQPVTDGNQLASPDALDTINLDRKFAFPLRDDKGKEVGTFDYVIQSANVQRQIIVQGQRASAVSGRAFLILNLKITNTQPQTIQLNTRDFLRLVVTSTPNEQLAPDIHNDPVEVQAISTKYTRVGIALDEEDLKKIIQLKVGEIDGEKENIDLKFNY